MEPVLRGCWENGACGSEICYNNEELSNKLNFCCCSSNLCNWNATIRTPSSSPIPPTEANFSTPYPDGMKCDAYILVSAASCLLIVFGAVLVFWYVHRPNRRHELIVPIPGEPTEIVTVPSQSIGLVHSLEEKAKGKFGSVYKGQLGHGEPVKHVAVKVFPLQDRESWRHECEIYRLPQMKHENILSFLGSEANGTPVQSYWLITEYHELGSLYDYLKAHVVIYEELLKIGHGIARGLALLHEELPPRGNQGLKPTVAHRDFKSKNVILKPDLTPCIADFGLARIFSPSETHIEALGQVGTRKYMAPEVLDGAISFTKDSLLRIDMYACGLVLWELVSRCSAQLGPVPPHKLPFDDEVGPNPSLEDMADVVVVRKLRPNLPECSNEYGEAMFTIKSTIEELWDQDAEARLSACCVESRLLGLLEKVQSNHIQQ